MKICFYLQRRFTPIGHTMAVILKKRYGVDQFCGYVSMRSNLDFLESQEAIHYTKLILDEDIYRRHETETVDLNYLKYLEKEYGVPNLWPFIDTDRVIRHSLFLREYPYDRPLHTHAEMLKLIQAYAKAAIQFLEEEKPDVVILPVIEGINAMLLYHVAKRKGIKTLFIQASRIGNKHTVTERYGELSYIQHALEELQTGDSVYPEHRAEAQKFLEEFRNQPTAYDPHDTPSWQPISRKQQFSFLLPRHSIHTIYWATKLFTDYIRNSNRSDYTNIKPWHHVIDRIRRKIRILIGFEDLYDAVDETGDFGFYPLQKEPEISISLFAPFYKDQLWLVRQIARSLPIHYILYVKDHPTMFGYHTRKFYNELKKIPNVKLIQPSLSSFHLTKNAKLIFTLTGTAGWEGLLLKKPVVTFGDVFYNALSMVKKCKAIEDLPYIVKEQLERFEYDEAQLVHLIAAIYKESADLDLTQLWDIEGGGRAHEKEKEIAPFVDLIAEKLNLKAL